MTRQSLPFAAALLSGLLIARIASAQMTGEWVVVVQDAELRTADKTSGAVYRGDVVQVSGVLSDMVCIAGRADGWIDKSSVLSLKRGENFFNEALRNDPKDVSALFGRAGIREAHADHDRAIADCGEALKLDPKYVRALQLRAHCWFEKGQAQKSVADLSEAIRVEPDDSWSHTLRGRLWAEQHASDKALFDLSEALRLDPDNTVAYESRAMVRYAQREYRKAAADCSQIIRLRSYSDEGFFSGAAASWH